MKKISLFILGFISALCITGIVYAINANEVEYNNRPLDEVLDELYIKANTPPVCLLTEGTSLTVGAKYACNLDNISSRNFYIISVDTDTVKLIMDRNITDDILVNGSKMLLYNAALTFFDANNPGYDIGRQWLTKVESVDIPTTEELKNAGGLPNWNVATAANDVPGYFGGSTSTVGNYVWLYNYTRACSTYRCTVEYPDTDEYPAGYWTKDYVSGYDNRVWRVGYKGYFATVSVNNTSNGIRPVITIQKSKLAG